MDYRPFYLARQWRSGGHQVTVVGASYSHLRTEEPTLDGSFTEETIDGIRYVWLKTPRYSGSGIGRVISMFAFVAQLMRYRKRLLETCRPNAVIAASTYLLDIFPAKRIAAASGAKLILEVHDLWPLTPIELGGFSRWHPLIMLLQYAENYAYRHADSVVSTLPNAESHMRDHGMAQHKFAFVPNGIDLSEWKKYTDPLPPEHANTLSELEQSGCFLIGYAGAHGPANALRTLLDTAKLLRDRPVKFVLVGQGPEKEPLQQMAKRENLSNVVFLPPIPKATVPQFLDAVDALYIGWNRKPIYRFGISPTKLVDYMMSSKPIIHAVEAGNDPVEAAGCGISCLPEDPVDGAKAIESLLQTTVEQRREMGQRGETYARSRHSYSVLAEHYLKAMR